MKMDCGRTSGGAGWAGRLGSRILPHCARQTLSRRISSRRKRERSSKQLTFTVWHCAPEVVQVQSVQGVGVRVSPMPTAWLPMTHVLASLHRSRFTLPTAAQGTRGLLERKEGVRTGGGKAVSKGDAARNRGEFIESTLCLCYPQDQIFSLH